MVQLKFDKHGVFIPQIVKLNVKRNKLDEEMINEYVNNECNFQIEYDSKSNPIFIKKSTIGG
jgi:hypothetical protein